MKPSVDFIVLIISRCEAEPVSPVHVRAAQQPFLSISEQAAQMSALISCPGRREVQHGHGAHPPCFWYPLEHPLLWAAGSVFAGCH